MLLGAHGCRRRWPLGFRACWTRRKAEHNKIARFCGEKRRLLRTRLSTKLTRSLVWGQWQAPFLRAEASFSVLLGEAGGEPGTASIQSSLPVSTDTATPHTQSP